MIVVSKATPMTKATPVRLDIGYTPSALRSLPSSFTLARLFTSPLPNSP